MSEREILTQWLGRAAGRLRLNLWLREASAMACWLLCAAALYQALRVTPVVPEVLAALLPLFVLAGIGLVALFAWRSLRRPTLAQAAAAADRRADLKDQLGSAWWFTEQNAGNPMVQLLLERATLTVQRLELRWLFPVVVPRGLPLACALALLAGALACLSPRVGVPLVNSAIVGPTAVPYANGRAQQADAQPAAAVSKREEVASAQLDELVRELAGDASPEAIAQALGARDARGAAQLIEAIRRRQAAQASTARAGRPQTEQMSDVLAQGILERLKELSTENSGAQPQAPPPAEDADRSTARLQRELREEMQDVQRSRPGQQSAAEDALNTMLRAISRNSTGGRELVRGETEAMQDAGRTSVGGGGAMGRRVGVSQAGGGNGDDPRTNPAGDPDSEPVLGKKTQRLAVQLQTVKVEQNPDEDPNGAEDAFYAATQAQASKLEYQAVTAHRRYGAEQSAARDRMPMAYRDAVKQYVLGQHRKERKGREE
jgi:hypothetical protein